MYVWMYVCMYVCMCICKYRQPTALQSSDTSYVANTSSCVTQTLFTIWIIYFLTRKHLLQNYWALLLDYIHGFFPSIVAIKASFTSVFRHVFPVYQKLVFAPLSSENNYSMATSSADFWFILCFHNFIFFFNKSVLSILLFNKSMTI